MARGQLMHWKHDDHDNPIDRFNQNAILDTYLYEVEFLGDKMTELGANITTKSMYAWCDVDGNKSLLLETFINHKKDYSALL